MGTMVRINAHQFGTLTHDEDKDYAMTLMVLISQRQQKIVPGIYYGEIREAAEGYSRYFPYPFRYDAHTPAGESKLYFGGYTCDDNSSQEEWYSTNLNQKSIGKGEYFTVKNLEGEELTFIIDSLADMNALQVPGD